ncbi:MAG: FAD-dependent oxidoreductase [bacterium]
MLGVEEKALEGIRQIVGSEHLLTNLEDLKKYSTDTSEWLKMPAAVVFPANTEEVAQIVKLANRYKFPIWPFSKGKNWSYGASMGLEAGAVILMLDRMNRVVEVNEELAYAVIEPGVTQKQLREYLDHNNIKLWTDCTDATPEGSVVGNAMERGIGYTPYWDHFGQLCGMEVVLPSGEILRTGGGPENSRTANVHKWGTGPYIEGLFAQANFGIVTKAGIWLMPKPEKFVMFLLELAKEEYLPAVIDVLRYLSLNRILLSNVHLTNDVLFLSAMQPYPYDRLADGQTYLSAKEMASVREKYRISPWLLSGGVYGTRKQVRLQLKLLKQHLRPYGRFDLLSEARLKIVAKITRFWKRHQDYRMVNAFFRSVTGASLEKIEGLPQVYPIFKGIPGEFVLRIAYFKSQTPAPAENLDPARDGTGFIWFSNIVPLTGSEIEKLQELCTEIFHKHGFDFACTFVMINPRCALTLQAIFYDKGNADETKRAQALRKELAAVLLAQGYQQYRTTVAYYDDILNCTPEFQKLANNIKRALDPHHVISPGRYGIGLTPNAAEPQMFK